MVSYQKTAATHVRPPPDLIQRSGRRVVAAGLVGPTRSSQGASISAGGCRTPWLERRRQYRSPALRIGIVAARPVYLLAVYIEELFSSSRQRSPGPAPATHRPTDQTAAAPPVELEPAPRLLRRGVPPLLAPPRQGARERAFPARHGGNQTDTAEGGKARRKGCSSCLLRYAIASSPLNLRNCQH